jgi:hypothetical protein
MKENYFSLSLFKTEASASGSIPVSHSIAISKEVKPLILSPWFREQSAKNSTESNRLAGQRTAVFRE